MKRILINATHNEEIRVALCKDHHLYDFDLENRTREQKKANIYKGHVTRVEPSLEAVFVEYGSARQGFLPLREIAPEYLSGNSRSDNLKNLIKEGDELIIQIEKEERGNKGAAISTYISLAGRYLVLMPNNTKGGGISRQISGKVRDEMRQIIANLDVPKGMSVIVRTAGIGKTYEDLAADLAHLLEIWADILQKNRKEPSPCLLYQEAGVVTRAMRDYLKDDIGEVWIDSEHAYNEAASFISQVMPTQMSKLRKYMDFEPMFVRFGIERQIESAYQREVRLPSGGSIVIDQTEAMVAIDINSAKSTKGADVAETAFHTNLEAADEIARQLRLRDMGGLIVIDFIDMADPKHQKEVEKRLIEATRYDRARVQFAEISKFGLLEMSRQRLRPSLDEATGYICPRCHGNGMIRDLRSLALSIMRQIEQLALKHRSGEVQAEVPTEIAAFLLNEKRESLVYLEQDSGTRITVLPHAHLESPNFSLHFNPDGFAPASYDRIIDTEEQLNIDRGYDVNWQTPEPNVTKGANHWQKGTAESKPKPAPKQAEQKPAHTPQAVAWLSNLFAPKAQSVLAPSLQNDEAAAAIEAIVNTGATSLGAFGAVAMPTAKAVDKDRFDKSDKYDKKDRKDKPSDDKRFEKSADKGFEKGDKRTDKQERNDKGYDKSFEKSADKSFEKGQDKKDRKDKDDKYPKREPNSRREPRDVIERGTPLVLDELADKPKKDAKDPIKADKELSATAYDKESKEPSKEVSPKADKEPANKEPKADKPAKSEPKEPSKKAKDGEFMVRIEPIASPKTTSQVVHLSLDGSKPAQKADIVSEPEVAGETIANDTADNTVVETPQVATAVETVAETANPAVETVAEPVAQTTESPASESNVITEVADTTENDTPASEPTKAKPQTDEQADEPVERTDEPSDEQIADVKTADDNVFDVATSDETVPSTPKAEPAQEPTLPRLYHTHKVITLPAVPSIRPNVALLERLSAQTGRSKNDPRVVLSACQTPITGTAGEFIRQTLADGETRLAQDGFVACFIDALAQTATPSLANFGNYGYPALPEHAHKVRNTEELAQFATTAGKSVPPALPDAPRAKNDPRGEKVAPNKLSELSEPVAPVVVADTTPATLDTPAPQTDKPKQDPSLLSEIGTALESLTHTVQELLDHANISLARNQDNKTTPESYKHMIENIAEQLLPQVGILKLATKKPAKKSAPKKPTKVAIKVPKVDTKPKTEIRKRKIKTDEVDGTDSTQNGDE